MTDPEFLRWMVARLINVYGEHPNTDFVMRLDEISKRIDAAQEEKKDASSIH